jgi:hypothetical protein
MRDEVVAEIHGKNSNYFSLDDSERSTCRRIAVNRCLEQNPEWLLHWESSLADLPEDHRNMARSFACDLIVSRVATIWTSTKAHAKRKFIAEIEEPQKKRGRGEDALKTCDKCQCKLICPFCDADQLKDLENQKCESDMDGLQLQTEVETPSPSPVNSGSIPPTDKDYARTGDEENEENADDEESVEPFDEEKAEEELEETYVIPNAIADQ